MRETLIAFVKATQAAADGEKGRFQLEVKYGNESLAFGYGYYDRDKVLYYLSDGEFVVLPTEEAVDRFLKSVGWSE